MIIAIPAEIQTIDALFLPSSTRSLQPIPSLLSPSEASERIDRTDVAMGGRFRIVATATAERAEATIAEIDTLMRRARIWASLLTRHTMTSDLSVLNSSTETYVRVGPTLAAVLTAAADAAEMTGGIVDPTLLADRRAVEEGSLPPPVEGGDWTLRPVTRGAFVSRAPDLAFDLDGVAKGWIADRTAAILARTHRSVVVDADGDLSLVLDGGEVWDVMIANGDNPDVALAHLRFTAPTRRSFGIATSGTSVHLWGDRQRENRHHLIDPRTNTPAVTDVVPATVIADSARSAETLAKAIIIAGSEDGLSLAAAGGMEAALLVLASGEIRMTETLRKYVR